MRDNCPFCEYKTEVKSEVLDYGDVIAFEPLNPVVDGHLLIVPKVHVSDAGKDYVVSGRVMEVASQIAKARGGDYNLITSKGKHATQTINHLHLHLVPRKENDGLPLPWSLQDNK